jgi:hypothetical protein
VNASGSRAGTEKKWLLCGVTHFALQYCDPELPTHGLVSSDAFLAAFDRLMTAIHHAARTKYSQGLGRPKALCRSWFTGRT